MMLDESVEPVDRGKVFEIFIPKELDLDTVNKICVRGKEFLPVVRCKECKKRGTVYCDLDYCGYGQADNWYCADGERKEQNDG